MAKSKKKRQQDFQKVKLKVGKKLKKGENVTNASFQTRTVQITQQLKSEKVGPSTKKKQNIQEILIQCRHYNANIRHEAVTGLKEIVTGFPEVLTTHLSDILEKSAELLNDKDGSVRQGTLRLYKAVLPKIQEKRLVPFFKMVCAHLCCAMTHINTDIQLDSLSLFDLLLEHFPKLIISEASQVMTNFIEQISRQKGEGQRSLSTNLGQKMTSMKWRTSVLGRIEKFLIAFLEFHRKKQPGAPTSSDVSSFKEYEPIRMQIFPKYVRNQWENPGFILSSFNDTSDSSDDLDSKFSNFVDMLIPLLLECWIEATPSHQVNIGTDHIIPHGTVGTLSSILNVTKLLFECVSNLYVHQATKETWSRSRSMQDFQQRLMVGFPYSLEEFVSTFSRQKEKDDFGTMALLNLKVCEIMASFVQDTQKSPEPHPLWLTDVLCFVHDFVKLKGLDKTIIAQSCKNVVGIVQKMLKAGVQFGCYSDMLADALEAMFVRFKRASYLSQEKKVYLEFFSSIVFDSSSSSCISSDLQLGFLRCLPELLPLAAKESPQMVALLIQSMRMAACRNCLSFLDATFFSKKGTEWFGHENGAILCIDQDSQRQLFSLLYFVPEIDLSLTKILTNLIRSERIVEENVTYLIHVIYNRFSRSCQTNKEYSLYATFLVNLLFGNTQHLSISDHSLSNNSSEVKYQVVDAPDHLPSWDRHEFFVQEVLKNINTSENGSQVKSVIQEFIAKYLCLHSTISSQTVYGIYKFASFCEDTPSELLHNIVHLGLCTLVGCVTSNNSDSGERTNNSLQRSICDFLWNNAGALCMCLSAIGTRVAGSSKENTADLIKVCLVILREEHRVTVLQNSEVAAILSAIVEHVKAKEPKDPNLESLLADLEYRCSSSSIIVS